MLWTHFNMNRATQSDYNELPQETRTVLTVRVLPVIALTSKGWRHFLKPRLPLTLDLTHPYSSLCRVVICSSIHRAWWRLNLRNLDDRVVHDDNHVPYNCSVSSSIMAEDIYHVISCIAIPLLSNKGKKCHKNNLYKQYTINV